MSKLVSDSVPSRRQFVQMGLAGAAVGLLTGGMELAFPPTAAAKVRSPRRKHWPS